MKVRGIRGAITVTRNGSASILSATRELLQKMMADNHVASDDIASIFFSVTPDLDADFPAKAARELGLLNVPLLCLKEIPVPNSLAMCIRILLHVNTELAMDDVKHIYLKGAVALRPDHLASHPR